MIKRWENYNNKKLMPVRSLYRNPITMQGDYPIKDLEYKRDLTPSNYRDNRNLYDKPDQVKFLNIYKILEICCFFFD